MDGRKYCDVERTRVKRAVLGLPFPDRTYLLVLPALIAKRPDRHTLEQDP